MDRNNGVMLHLPFQGQTYILLVKDARRIAWQGQAP